MRLGIGSYTYGWHSGTYGWDLSRDRDPLTADALIERAAGFGLNLVQIVVRPDLAVMKPAELKRLRAQADGFGIELEIGTAGSDPRNLSDWIRAGQILGSRLMRTIFTDPSAGLVREEAQLLEILPDLRAAGIALAIENHETSSCHDLRQLVDRIGDPLIGVCLDPVNSLGRGEGTWEVAEILLPVTLNLHVKDYTVTRGGTDMGFTVTGARTGEGKLDIPRLLEQMRSHRADVGVILEQWTPLNGSIDAAIREQERWAEDGVSRLKKWIGNDGCPRGDES